MRGGGEGWHEMSFTAPADVKSSFHDICFLIQKESFSFRLKIPWKTVSPSFKRKGMNLNNVDTDFGDRLEGTGLHLVKVRGGCSGGFHFPDWASPTSEN